MIKSDMCFDLPEIVTLEDAGGNPHEYLSTLLKHYEEIFAPPLMFRGKKIIPIINPQEQGKHFSFLHMTSTGKDEATREFDLRRCERICWVRRIVENTNKDCIKIWENTRINSSRKSRTRTIIWHENENFVIVLEERTYVYALITTYLPDNRRKLNLQKEYSEYIKIQNEKESKI